MRVSDLAKWLAAPFEGDGDKEIRAVAALDLAGEDELAFAAGRKAGEAARSSKAGCLLAGFDMPNPTWRPLIRVKDPRAAFARAVALFHPPAPAAVGVHATAFVDPSATLGEGVAVGPHSSIAAGSVIGGGSVIGAGCAIGENVRIGNDCRIHANVSIYAGVEIGDRVILHSGCVLGADGFGFVLAGNRYEKFPQIGKVAIGDDVEIGANCAVDRAALGVTRIGDGTKLDNMVHVAHNCDIGRHVVIAAQTGFSGGVTVGDYAVIGGQVGIGDKARIEARAVLGSGCGVLTSKIVRGGQVMWGTPARPLREHLEQLASLSRLPGMRKELQEIGRRLAALEEKFAED